MSWSKIPTSSTITSRADSEWIIGNTPEEGGVSFRATRSFHPGVTTTLFRAHFPDYLGNSSTSSPNWWEILPFFHPIHPFQFSIYIEGAARQNMRVEFTRDDLSYETSSATKEAVPKP